MLAKRYFFVLKTMPTSALNVDSSVKAGSWRTLAVKASFRPS
jgi:hypothetical protein